MPYPEWVESARPLKNLLIGTGIPVTVIATCAAVGILLALAFGSADGESVKTGAYFGALLGFFASLYGIAELLIGFFFSSGPALNLTCRAAGYLAVWSAAAGIILYSR